MSRAVMQQALEALEDIGGEWGFISKRTVPKRIEVITALREELAKPEQELTDADIKAVLGSLDPETKRLPPGLLAFARAVIKANNTKEKS